jgi:hypothetical protein
MEHLWPPPPLYLMHWGQTHVVYVARELTKSIPFCYNSSIRLIQRSGWMDDLFLIPISYLVRTLTLEASYRNLVFATITCLRISSRVLHWLLWWGIWAMPHHGSRDGPKIEHIGDGPFHLCVEMSSTKSKVDLMTKTMSPICSVKHTWSGMCIIGDRRLRRLNCLSAVEPKLTSCAVVQEGACVLDNRSHTCITLCNVHVRESFVGVW